MSYVSQQTLRATLLAYLFAAAQSERAGRDVSEMKKIFKFPIGDRRIQIAIDDLESDELVEDIGDRDSYEYALTAEGYDSAERAYLDPESQNFKSISDQLIEKLRSSSSTDSIIVMSEEENRIPASDRFVEVGHNTPGYHEVVSSVEVAAESIRQSNTLSAEERSWIQSNLDIAISALRKGGKLLVEGIKTFALEPLKAALANVSEEKLKSAISLAILSLRNFLGL